jgi:hypothetical protein
VKLFVAWHTQHVTLLLCLYLGYSYIDFYIDRIKSFLEVENIRRWKQNTCVHRKYI